MTRREDRPEVTVVVPTHDRPILLQRTVDALARQRGVCFDVLVVDDGSRPAARVSPPAVAAWTSFRILRNDVARGPARARNRGWRAARGPLVAFTDDDCVPEPGWLATLASTLQDAPAAVAGVGGRVLPVGDGLVSRYMTFHRILEPPRSLNYLVTASCAFRREALESVRGFDERVRTPGGEDPGLSFALRRRGFRLGFAPDAVVRHHYRESARDFLRTFYRYGRGCRVVMEAGCPGSTS